MIYLYSGTPGSGKSLHVAELIYNSKNGFYSVIGNIPVEKTHKKISYTFCDNFHITPDFLISFSKKYFETHRFREGRLKLVIDEAQLLFNSREWQKEGRAEWLSFFTQHRKYGYDIYLIAQFDRMLDRQIRSLIEYEFVHRKVSNFGWKGKLFSFWAMGRLFVCVKIWYPMKEKTGSEFFLMHKKYYKLYDTFSTWEAPE